MKVLLALVVTFVCILAISDAGVLKEPRWIYGSGYDEFYDNYNYFRKRGISETNPDPEPILKLNNKERIEKRAVETLKKVDVDVDLNEEAEELKPLERVARYYPYYGTWDTGYYGYGEGNADYGLRDYSYYPGYNYYYYDL